MSEISRIVTKDYRYVSEILRIGNVPEIPVLRGGASEVGRQVRQDSSPALHTHRPILAMKSFAHEDACLLLVFKCVLSLIGKDSKSVVRWGRIHHLLSTPIKSILVIKLCTCPIGLADIGAPLLL